MARRSTGTCSDQPEPSGWGPGGRRFKSCLPDPYEIPADTHVVSPFRRLPTGNKRGTPSTGFLRGPVRPAQHPGSTRVVARWLLRALFGPQLGWHYLGSGSNRGPVSCRTLPCTTRRDSETTPRGPRFQSPSSGRCRLPTFKRPPVTVASCFGEPRLRAPRGSRWILLTPPQRLAAAAAETFPEPWPACRIRRMSPRGSNPCHDRNPI
jgi:hypothetical protein